jgi:hypothetical protein
LESLVFRFTKIYEQKTPQRLNEPIKRALTPLLAAGLASVYKMSRVPYGEDSTWLAAGNLQSLKGILVWATARENLTLFSLCFRIAWTQSLWRFPLV